MFALPCHVLGNVDGGLRIRKQHPIPVLFESPMGPSNGIVFAVVGRVVGKPAGHTVLICEVHGPLDELGYVCCCFRDHCPG